MLVNQSNSLKRVATLPKALLHLNGLLLNSSRGRPLFFFSQVGQEVNSKGYRISKRPGGSTDNDYKLVAGTMLRPHTLIMPAVC
jgi:hypothetical protein